MLRSQHNPILTRQDIRSTIAALQDVTSVFNPGAVRVDDLTNLLLRVQNRGRETLLLKAESNDGAKFEIDPRPVKVEGLSALNRAVYHVYDPRIVLQDNRFLVSLAVDTDSGCYSILTAGDSLSLLEYLGMMHEGAARNGVMFPEVIAGRYCGLVRPNNSVNNLNTASGDEIWLVESSDLETWSPVKPVLRGRPHYWDELIGSGPPPIKTREGWLHMYHGVATHFMSVNIYQAGVCLLNLTDPTLVVARSRYNILEPRESYELAGQVPNVVFPTGLVVHSNDSEGFAADDSRVDIYYGAADTVVGVATATVAELVHHCHAGNEV